jgi:hypothetical protein
MIKSPRFSLETPVHDKLLALTLQEDYLAKVNIVIAIPQRKPDDPIATSIEHLLQPQSTVYKVVREYNACQDYADVRNKLIDQALLLDPDYIMMLDDDILLPQHFMLVMYNTMMDNPDVDVLSGIYYQKIPAESRMASKMRMPTWGTRLPDGRHIAENPKPGTLLPVNWVLPGGALFIRASVFSKIEKPYFNMIFDKAKGKMSAGEDQYYILKCNQAGLKTCLHGDLLCGHVDFANNKIYWGDRITEFKPGLLMLDNAAEEKKKNSKRKN